MRTLKKALSLVLSLLMVCSIIVSASVAVSAETMAVSTFADLTSAVDCASDGDTVVLSSDINGEFDTLIISKKLILDLGGHTFCNQNNTTVIISAEGELTLKNGLLSSNGIVDNYGTPAVENNGKFILESNAVINGSFYSSFASRYGHTYFGKAGSNAVIKGAINSFSGNTGSAIELIGAEALIEEAAYVGGNLQNGIPTVKLSESSVLTVVGGNIKNTRKDGYAIESNYSVVNISGGIIDGYITYVPYNNSLRISGGLFNYPLVQRECAPGFVPSDTPDGNGYYTVIADDNFLNYEMNKEADNNKFGLDCEYLTGTILGVQKKAALSAIAGSDKTSESGQETGKDIRFVVVLKTSIVQNADDYGFVLGRVKKESTRHYNTTQFDNLKYGSDLAKTISAKNTKNNVCGNEAYGDPDNLSTGYKYITCAANGLTDDDMVIARFYVKQGDKVYYAKYSGYNYKYTGCISDADITSLGY
ncbi:MAG: hypothetical protein IJT79_09630 [Ruminococcus sp.]|nr:hypothetical protein [Ruminococcus sp.]